MVAGTETSHTYESAHIKARKEQGTWNEHSRAVSADMSLTFAINRGLVISRWSFVHGRGGCGQCFGRADLSSIRRADYRFRL
jgi:hypothetical protein